MRKLVLILVLLLLLASSAAAQRRGFGGGGFRGSQGAGFRGSHRVPVFRGGFAHRISPRRPFGSGFGNVAFPAGDFWSMRQRGIRPGLIMPFGFGFGGFGGFGFDAGFSSYSLGYTPFFGGTPLGGYFPYATAGSQPNVIVISTGAAQAAPASPVVVNEIYSMPARPRVEEAPIPQAVRPAEPAFTRAESRPAYYLIAMKSGVIRAALSYWVEGSTLHYVDRGQQHRQTPLSSVDRGFSVQLNKERDVEFPLPPG